MMLKAIPSIVAATSLLTTSLFRRPVTAPFIACKRKQCSVPKGSSGQFNMTGKFYAVAVGRKTGIFLSWDECQPLVRVKAYNQLLVRLS